MSNTDLWKIKGLKKSNIRAIDTRSTGEALASPILNIDELSRVL